MSYFEFAFSPETPVAVIRCPSMNRLLGSDLSTSCGSLLSSRRPRSYESLPTLLPSSMNADHHYCCPAGEDCYEEKLTNATLTHHINEVHQTPTISFGCSSAEISLPPRAPIENASLILLLDGKQFWVKVVTE